MEGVITDEQEHLVLEILPTYVGWRYARLVRSLGYRTLEDLSKVREIELSALGGFGEGRMTQIRAALADHDLKFYDGPKADLTDQIQATMQLWTQRLGTESAEPSRTRPRRAPRASSPTEFQSGGASGRGKILRRAVEA